MAKPDKRAIPSVAPEDEISFAVDLNWITGSARFDASYYNPDVARAISILKQSGMKLRKLGDIVENVFIPPRCRRTFVRKEYGVPFLRGSHIVHFIPDDLKFVSLEAQKHIDKLIIKSHTILITRSGTIGRVTIVPDSWDGWAATEDLLRVIPKEGGNSECPLGFLYAYLSSFVGQAQLTANIYGAVVDHLTEDQTKSVLVPIARTQRQKRLVQEIHASAMESLRLKEAAVRDDLDAVEGVRDFLNMAKEKPKKQDPPLSLYPLDPKEALRAFMQVEPEKVKQREEAEKGRKSRKKK